MKHFFSQIQVKTKKKRSSPRMGHFFFPEFKYRPTIRCTPESNLLGDADVDHTQTGYTQIIGGIYPPPLVSAPLVIVVYLF